MSTKAYVLIETAVNYTRDVSSALSLIKEVTQVDPVTGPYDIIVVLETSNLDDIGDLVANHIHKIPGISRTVTCLSLAVSIDK
jgi:DNA-binding Lrp family transcriptional regulator